MTNHTRPLLPKEDVQDLLVCGRTTLYEIYIGRGYLTPIKVGRKILFDATQVHELIEKIRTGEIVIGSRDHYPTERAAS